MRLSDLPSAEHFLQGYWMQTADLLYDSDVVRAVQNFVQTEPRYLSTPLGAELTKISEAGFIDPTPRWADQKYMEFWDQGGGMVLVPDDLEKILTFLAEWESK
jgi:hypothetical protein